MLLTNAWLSLLEVVSNRFRRRVTPSYRLDDRTRAGDRVPGPKNACHSRHRRARIDREKTPLRQVAHLVRREKAQVCLLSDGCEDTVGLHEELAAGNGHRSAAAILIRLPQPDLYALKSPESVPFGQHSRRLNQELERNPFGLRGSDLFTAGQHLLSVAAIENLDRLGS
jgi:hypothetical protein